MLKKCLAFLLITCFSASHAETTHEYEVGEVTASEAHIETDECPTLKIQGDYDFTSPCVATLKLFTVGKMYQSNKSKHAVYDKAKEGAFDHTGKLIIPIKYDKLNTFYTDIAGVKQGEKWAFITTKGKIITPFMYDEIDEFGTDIPLAIVRQGENYGVVDNHVTTVIPVAYAKIDSIGVVEDNQNRLFAVQKGTKWALFDKHGKQLTDFTFDEFKAYSFDEGVLGAKTDGKWGYINPQGNWVIPPMYQDVDFVNNGLLAVQNEQGIGFVDKNNTVIIPLEYDTFWQAVNGTIRVKSGNDFYLYDKNGKQVSE